MGRERVGAVEQDVGGEVVAALLASLPAKAGNPVFQAYAEHDSVECGDQARLNRARKHAKSRCTDDRLESGITLLLRKDKTGLGVGAFSGHVADQERDRRPSKPSRPP